MNFIKISNFLNAGQMLTNGRPNDIINVSSTTALGAVVVPKLALRTLESLKNTLSAHFFRRIKLIK